MPVWYLKIDKVLGSFISFPNMHKMTFTCCHLHSLGCIKRLNPTYHNHLIFGFRAISGTENRSDINLTAVSKELKSCPMWWDFS